MNPPIKLGWTQFELPCPKRNTNPPQKKPQTPQCASYFSKVENTPKQIQNTQDYRICNYCVTAKHCVGKMFIVHLFLFIAFCFSHHVCTSENHRKLEGASGDHRIQAPAQAGSATADHPFQCCLSYKQNQTLLISE